MSVTHGERSEPALCSPMVLGWPEMFKIVSLILIAFVVVLDLRCFLLLRRYIAITRFFQLRSEVTKCQGNFGSTGWGLSDRGSIVKYIADPPKSTCLVKAK